jgi:hypothetical protein
MTEMEKMVHSNLDDAMANGYDVSDWPVDDIVNDLLAYSHECEDNSPHELKPHVESWIAARRNMQ